MNVPTGSLNIAVIRNTNPNSTVTDITRPYSRTESWILEALIPLFLGLENGEISEHHNASHVYILCSVLPVS